MNPLLVKILQESRNEVDNPVQNILRQTEKPANQEPQKQTQLVVITAEKPANQEPQKQTQLVAIAAEKPAYLAVQAAGEYHGAHLGVFADGTTYASQRGLATLCGVADPAIIKHSREWAEGKRSSALAKILLEKGWTASSLTLGLVPGRQPGTQELAYPELVVTAFVQYYASYADVRPEMAKIINGKLIDAGFRALAHSAAGIPIGVLSSQPSTLDLSTRTIKDRLTLNRPPLGYWAVFNEAVNFQLDLAHHGISIDPTTIPDISFGIVWSRYWAKNNLDAIYGPRVEMPHCYPRYFPQSRSKKPKAWTYPDAALPKYRNWFASEYIPNALPKYLKTKRRQLGTTTVDRILQLVPQLSLPATSDTT